MKPTVRQGGWLIGGIAGSACAAGAVAATSIASGHLALGGTGLGALGGFVLGAAFTGAWSMTRAKDLIRFADRLHSSEDDCIDASSAPAWLAPIATAITDSRSKAAARITAAESRLREIEIRRRITEAERRQVEATLHSLRDAVLVTDTFDEIKMANEAAATLLGFNLEDAVHKPLGDALKDKALVRVIEDARAAAESQERRHVEYTMSTPDEAGNPEQRAFDITLTPMPALGAEGGASGVVTILRDVTREKEIAQMKSDFVSQVSHELRTPLSSINAYVEMLLDGEATDEGSRQEFYDIIKNEADRLTRLIDNMLNISRIEAGIVEVDDTEVDFVKVAREVVEIMQPQAKLKNITLLLKDGPLIYTAQASQDMMHQVLLNLVSNAVKYTQEGGRVTVTVENDDASRSVMVSIQDTGLGIPPEAMNKLFQKFYRIDNYKRVAKGTGLGLNLVKSIVETVHGGQVGVSSQVGLGSRFWFTIPFDRAGKTNLKAA